MNKYGKLLQSHLSHAVLVVLAILLGLVYWFRQQESYVEVPEPGTKSVVTPDPVFPTQEWEKVTERMTTKPPIEETRLVVVMQFDMFDVQTVMGKEDFERRANERFRDAQTAFDQRDLDGAREICEEIIYRIYPSHLPAKALLEEIRAKEQAVEEEQPPAEAQPFLEAQPFAEPAIEEELVAP